MKKIIRSVRGWLYRHSRKAQTDCIEAAMYDCTQGIVSAIMYALDADALKPTAEEARYRLERIKGDALAQTHKTRRMAISAAAGIKGKAE